MSDIFDSMLRNFGLLASIALWFPIVMLWCALAPLFCLLDVLNAMTRGDPYLSLEWRFCGIRMQANYRHVDAGGGRQP